MNTSTSFTFFGYPWFLLGLGAALLCGCDDDTVVKSDPLPGVEHGDEGRCPGTVRPINDGFCATEAVSPDCSQVDQTTPIDLCGVPLKAPPKDPDSGNNVALERSTTVEEYAGSGPPDLGWLFPEGYPEPADPDNSQDVTVNGVVNVFSHGCQSNEVDVSVYTVKRTGGADEAELGELVGSTVTTAEDCSIDGVAEENEDCGTRYECRYSYPGVPSETELVFLTEGAVWSQLYDYGVFIPNSEVQGGEWEHDVRALAADDYTVIAQVAMGSPITPGNGAMAGEVHDCGDVRLLNAVADVDVSRFITTYFTDNEENPLPNLDASATSTLGLYGAMDVRPGPVTVAAAGIVDGKLVAIGYFRARIYPDSVTSFTFRGLKPFQVSE